MKGQAAFQRGNALNGRAPRGAMPPAGTPPAWMRKVEAVVLMRVFACAFDVEPPALASLDADGALRAFRLFTAACMEEALADADFAARYRERLGAGAHALGECVRRLLHIRPDRAMGAVRFFYRGIRIELVGELPGQVRFGPCSFSGRYTPRDCWFMSAFDEGFMRGMTGRDDARLVFACRLTEGAPCCRATFA